MGTIKKLVSYNKNIVLLVLAKLFDPQNFTFVSENSQSLGKKMQNFPLDVVNNHYVNHGFFKSFKKSKNKLKPKK